MFCHGPRIIRPGQASRSCELCEATSKVREYSNQDEMATTLARDASRFLNIRAIHLPGEIVWSRVKYPQWRRTFTTSLAYLSIPKDSGTQKETSSTHIQQVSDDSAQERTPQRRGTRKYNASENALLLQMRSEGKSAPEIGKALGRSANAIYKAFQRREVARLITRYTKEQDEEIAKAGPTAAGLRHLQRRIHDLSTLHLDVLQARYRKVTKSQTITDRPGRRNPFTSAENALIKELTDQGIPTPEIVKRLLPRRTNASSVRRQYFRIVPRELWSAARNSYFWTQAEKEQLRGLMTAGVPRLEIASRMGRSIGSIKKQCQVARAENTGVNAGHGLRIWSKEETQRLIEMDASHKYSVLEIARTLGRSVHSVDSKLKRLGAARKRTMRNDSEEV